VRLRRPLSSPEVLCYSFLPRTQQIGGLLKKPTSWIRTAGFFISQIALDPHTNSFYPDKYLNGALKFGGGVDTKFEFV
jgi:hypothetical protein